MATDYKSAEQLLQYPGVSGATDLAIELTKENAALKERILRLERLCKELVLAAGGKIAVPSCNLFDPGREIIWTVGRDMTTNDMVFTATTKLASRVAN